MPTSNLMNHITTKYPKMTKAEKKVADFVLSSPQEALHATITDLARMCHVGDTSVFRFCRTLELNGYQDFKLSLALSTTNSNSLEDRENINVNDSASGKEVAEKVLLAYEAALKETFSSLNFKSISKAVDLIANARTVHLFGFGGSGTSAKEAQNKFLKIMPNVMYNTDSHIQLTQAALLREGDVAIIFSNSGITKDCIEIARLCSSAKASVIFITKFAKTPAIQYSDILLLCGANEGPMEGGSISAKISQLFLIDILYAELFRHLNNVAIENKQKTAQVIADKMM